MEIATKPLAEVNSRVHEPPGPEARGSERVSPEIRNETPPVCIAPPPVSIWSMGGNFPPPDAGIPFSAGSGGGRFVPPAEGFRTEQQSYI